MLIPIKIVSGRQITFMNYFKSLRVGLPAENEINRSEAFCNSKDYETSGEALRCREDICLYIFI